MIIDTHIHLAHHQYNGEFPYLALEDGEYQLLDGTLEQLLSRIKAAGIGACIDPAIDIESNGKILAGAEREPGFWFAAVGLHPTRTFRYTVMGEDGKLTERRVSFRRRREIEALADHPAVVAIGETGLDYHHERREQHRLRQKLWFIWQLKLAHRKKLPVVLHIREAEEDALRILKKYRHCLHGGVKHCFSGSAKLAEEYVGLGLKLGIGGALLEDKPGLAELEQAVIQTPLESLLLETDGPYVKPDCPELPKKQLRKARNTSLILPAVAERIAELKKTSPEEVIRVTSEAAAQLFKIAE